jgi:hypothetical protein
MPAEIRSHSTRRCAYLSRTGRPSTAFDVDLAGRIGRDTEPLAAGTGVVDTGPLFRRATGKDGNPLLELVRAVDPEVDEIQFNDALTAYLRRGRFLLLIVGDGIREG